MKLLQKHVLKLFLFSFCGLLMLSCTKTQEEQDWLKNRLKWERVRTSSYTFTLKTICFCTLERVGPHTIDVKDAKIVAVDGLPYDISKTGPLMTIDELFVFIKTSLDKKPDQQTIQYNSSSGYPEQIFFDFSKMMADEEIGYQISDVKL